MGLGKKKILSQGASGIVGTDNFAPKLYTGNGGTKNVTGVGFAPDFVWVKDRDTAYQHNIYDSIRGATKALEPNSSTAQYTLSGLTSFDSDGFTVGGNAGNNQANSPNIAWCWKAGGAASSNTSGSITSQVSANQDAGFSIVKYAGTQASGATVGHGLSSAPEMIIAKRIDNAEDWVVYHSSVGNTKTLNLNNGDAEVTDSAFNNTTPSSTVFTLDNCASGSCINSNSGNYIAYCFTSITGYQKIGSYVGTGGSISAINVGFEPRFVMIKSTGNTSGNWAMLDNQRLGTSLHQLSANGTHAEYTNQGVTFTSTGFSPRQSQSGDTNTSGVTFIYLAIK